MSTLLVLNVCVFGALLGWLALRDHQTGWVDGRLALLLLGYGMLFGIGEHRALACGVIIVSSLIVIEIFQRKTGREAVLGRGDIHLMGGISAWLGAHAVFIVALPASALAMWLHNRYGDAWKAKFGLPLPSGERDGGLYAIQYLFLGWLVSVPVAILVGA